MFKVKLENAESSWPPPLNLIAFSVKLCRRLYLRITTQLTNEQPSSASSSTSILPPPPKTQSTAGWWYTYYKAWLKSKLKKNDNRNPEVYLHFYHPLVVITHIHPGRQTTQQRIERSTKAPGHISIEKRTKRTKFKRRNHAATTLCRRQDN